MYIYNLLIEVICFAPDKTNNSSPNALILTLFAIKFFAILTVKLRKLKACSLLLLLLKILVARKVNVTVDIDKNIYINKKWHQRGL